MKTSTLRTTVGFLQGPLGGLIGASFGCSAWQIRVLAETQRVSTGAWLILMLIFLGSVACSPWVAYYGLMARRWSGLRTSTTFIVCMILTNALFVAAGYLLASDLFRDKAYFQVLILVAAILSGGFVISPLRRRMAETLEAWRDQQ